MTQIIAGRPATGAGGPARATSNAVSEREDLANFITMITRDETPFLSSIGTSKATAIYHEWQTDELNAPGNSRIPEGQDFLSPIANGTAALTGVGQLDGDGTPTTISPQVGSAFSVTGPNRTRLGNYTQINGKTIAVSGTKRAVDQAGVADEYAYQLKKRGTEMRRDVEFDMVHSHNRSAAVGAQDGTARSAGGYQSFVNDDATCDYVGTFKEPSTVNAGTFGPRTSVAQNNAATKAALALTNIDSVMQKIYEQGGKATRIMLSPKLRRDFSDLMVSDTGVRRQLDGGTLRQSVDVYMSDFGELMVVPNYIMGLSFANTNILATNDAVNASNIVDSKDFSALVYDPMYFAMAYLRPMQEVDVGQQGDSTKGMMIEESTLEVRNPLGCGAIYGLQ